MDAYGPNDEYPDDPDFECKDCGHPFDRSYDQDGSICPKCDSTNVGGGGYYG